VVSLAWFPSGDYEEAIQRWPSLAEDWSDVPHGDYSARLDGNHQVDAQPRPSHPRRRSHRVART
jgi:hypothetical protein